MLRGFHVLAHVGVEGFADPVRVAGGAFVFGLALPVFQLGFETADVEISVKGLLFSGVVVSFRCRHYFGSELLERANLNPAVRLLRAREGS